MKLVHAQKIADNVLAIVCYAYELFLQLDMKGCQTASLLQKQVAFSSLVTTVRNDGKKIDPIGPLFSPFCCTDPQKLASMSF